MPNVADFGLDFGFDSDFTGYNRGVRSGASATTELDRELAELREEAARVQRELMETRSALDGMAASARRSERAIRAPRDEMGRFTRSAAAASGAAKGTGAAGLAGGAGLRGMAAGAAAAGAAALGAAYAVGRVTAAAYTMGTTAEETESKFQTVYGDMADEVDRFGAGFFNVAGMTQTEGRGMISTFSALAQGMEISGSMGSAFFAEMERIAPGLESVGEASADTGIAAVSLAGDLASFHNANVPDVLADIRSGLTGEIEPLRKYGIELDAAAVNQKALALTGKATADELTNADKILARLTLAYERAGVAVGDLDRTKGSLANRTRYLIAAVKENAETLARSLVPAMKEAVSFTAELLERNKGVVRFWGSVFSVAVGNTIRDFINLGSSIAGLFGFFVDLASALGLTADKFDVGATKAGPFTLALAAVAGVADVVAGALYGLAEGVIWVLEKGSRLAGWAALISGNTAGYAAWTAAAENFRASFERLDASEREWKDRRADAWGDRFVSQLAKADGSVKDSGDSVLDLVDLFGQAEGAATRAGRAAAAAGSATGAAAQDAATELEEQTERAAELRGVLDYMASAEGRRALALARQNDLLERQVALLREGIGPVAARGPAGLPDAPPVSLPPIEVPGIEVEEPASKIRQALGGAVDYVRAKFAGLGPMGGATFGSLVDTSAAFATAAGSAFGTFAGIAADAYEATGQSAGAAFEIQKAFLIGQAIANTYSSAVASYNALAGIPVVGPVLGAAAAGVAVAAGIANVAKIRAAKPGGSASGGADYGGAGSVSGGGGVPTASRPYGAGAGAGQDGRREGAHDRDAAERRAASRDMDRAVSNLATATRQLREDGVRVEVRGVVEYDTIRLQEARGSSRVAAEGVGRRASRGLRRQS